MPMATKPWQAVTNNEELSSIKSNNPFDYMVLQVHVTN